jgi:hypothetical protein
MQSKATSVEEYIGSLPPERKEIITKIREAIIKNLPAGFSEEMSYGMIGYVVPQTLYPEGYHCDKKLPLPFINLASQKNYISLYHMGLYKGTLLDWFRERWEETTDKKLDMGKCCIRFKKYEDIPLELISDLSGKLSPQQWINIYEKNIKS